MKPIHTTSLVLGALLVGVWATGPEAATRARRQGDLRALTAGTVHEHPMGEAAPAVGPGVLVVDLVDGSDDARLAELSSRLGATLAWVHPESRDEALASGQVPDLAAALALLAAEPDVEAAEPELEVFALGFPNDPLYPRQWNLQAMGAPAGWASTARGRGVVVAVVDTGVTAVEDLDATRVLPGMSFVQGASWQDDNGHGTHVAGTIAQSTHNAVGVAGVAPEASILPVKVLSGFGGGSSAQVAAGIDWAVDQGADVINLSLGGPVYSSVIHVACRKARQAGVIVVAAAGNDGRHLVSWPGALREVLGVSATGPDGSLAPYSNRGLGVDLSAPGGDKRVEDGGILQDTVQPGGEHAYLAFQGTSMAAPHVSGAAAALLSTGFLDAAGVEAVLLSGADGGLWSPQHGWGKLDLEGSLGVLGGQGTTARFLLGLAFGWLIAGLSGAGRVFRVVAASVAGVSAGGLPGVTLSGATGALLARGVLSWPVVWLGPVWGQAGAWLAVFVAGGVAFVLGAGRWSRPVALGLCAGVGAHLFHGLAHGSFAPWWLPGGVATTWFGAQAVVCVLAAMTLSGVERLERSRGTKGAR